jgi:nucleoprotein TPR
MFTEVYADHVHLQDEYATKCTEYDHMDSDCTLAQVLVAQIEVLFIIATHPDRLTF